MGILKTIGRSSTVQTIGGEMIAQYLKLIWHTNRMIARSDDYPKRLRDQVPFIVASWHGQHFLVPFARPPGSVMKAMVSRSADGEFNAIALQRMGVDLIRASGGKHAHQIKKRGGVRGFLEAVRALREGQSIAMTADVPKGPARVCGEGVIALAKKSGRPIVPMASATSLGFNLPTWDRATISLPFGRMAVTLGRSIYVPADADEAEFEARRLEVEQEINDTIARARRLVNGK